MEPSISVSGLGKQYRHYMTDRPQTLQEAVVRGFRGVLSHKMIWALRNVTFDVPAGNMVGVIGRNGAGKSTLLRLIGGVGSPDEGSIRTQGRIGALIDLGAGFHAELSGWENVYINGVISGLTRQEVTKRFDEIVAFSELQDFIDSPLRTYSTGMQLRLGFAVAAFTKPEFLLIDEVLAVGDARFQKKCLDWLNNIKQEGSAILLVSHDTGLIEKLCDTAVWLEKGEVAGYGPADIVTHLYHESLLLNAQVGSLKNQESRCAGRVISEKRLGSLEIEITHVEIINLEGRPLDAFLPGDPVRIQIEFFSKAAIPSPIFVVTIRREDDYICLDANSITGGLFIPQVDGKGKIEVLLKRLDLNAGQYFIDVGIFEKDWKYAFDYHWRVYPIVIQGSTDHKGILSPPQYWDYVLENGV